MVRSTAGKAGGFVKFPRMAVWSGNIATPVFPHWPQVRAFYSGGGYYGIMCHHLGVNRRNFMRNRYVRRRKY